MLFSLSSMLRQQPAETTSQATNILPADVSQHPQILQDPKAWSVAITRHTDFSCRCHEKMLVPFLVWGIDLQMSPSYRVHSNNIWIWTCPKFGRDWLPFCNGLSSHWQNPCAELKDSWWVWRLSGTLDSQTYMPQHHRFPVGCPNSIKIP